MFKVLAFTLLALASAQTSTDAPAVPKNYEVVATFDGDCATHSADHQAMLVAQLNAYYTAFFDAESVETTLNCGSIIASSRVTGGVSGATDRPVFSSVMFGDAVINSEEIPASGGSGSRYNNGNGGMMGKGEGGKAGMGMGMGKAGKGEAGEAGKGMGMAGKAGKGMAGEAGKGMAGEAGKGMGKGEAGKGMGSGKGEAGKGMGNGKGEAGKGMGSGKGESGEAGGKGKGSESGFMHNSVNRAVSSDTIATLSAGIVLVAGVSLLAVRRHRQSRFNGEYELQVDANDIEVVIPTEDTPLVV